MKLRDQDNFTVLGGFLGITALLAALLLAVVSQLTADPIKAARERTRQSVFHRLGLSDYDRVGNESSFEGCSFTPVYNGDELCGFVGQGTGGGYGGEIIVLAGFDVNGKITGVQVLQHKETPGLGANVCERKFQRTIFNFNEKSPEVPTNRYLDQFNGMDSKSAGMWKIRKDGGSFDYMTGATVTGRAVTAAVDTIAEKFVSWRKGDVK